MRIEPIFVSGLLVGLGACAPGDTDEPFIDYAYRELAPPVEMTVCDEYEVMGLEGAPITQREEYNLPLINAELDHNPHLVEITGLAHVASCDDARHYIEARNEYLRADTAEPERAEGAEMAMAEQAIRSGDEIAYKRGVVQVDDRCTGWMISEDTVVTAAHCLLSESGTESMNIRYFDEGGKRLVSWWNESLQYEQSPYYLGSGSGVSDIGIIQRSQPWRDTDGSDYLRVMTNWQGHLVGQPTTYGAGFSKFTGTGFGTLRSASFEVERTTYERIESRARWTQRMCRGDSGGPLMLNIAGHDVVVASHSFSHKDGTDVCAEQGALQAASRTTWQNFKWIRDAAGLDCTLQTVGEYELRRCF